MKRSNPWHGLLFLQGHIADADLARTLAGGVRVPRSRQHPGLLGRLRYLGGRPMHAGWNFDLEEPLVEEEAPRPAVPLRDAACATC